jgi:hypothetical protein
MGSFLLFIIIKINPQTPSLKSVKEASLQTFKKHFEYIFYLKKLMGLFYNLFCYYSE